MPVDTRDLEAILDRIHEWTRSADTKIDILTAVEAAVMALLLPNLTDWIRDPATATDQKLAFLIGFGFLVSALIKSLQALFPRTSDRWWTFIHNWWFGVEAPPMSITFFGHIADKSVEDYRTRLDTITDAELRDDWTSQIHISAKIAGRKHHNIKLGILLFCIGLLVVGITFVWLSAGT